MNTYGIQPLKLKTPKLNKVKMPKIQEVKMPKLSYGGKKHKFGGGNDYYNRIFK